MRGDEFEEARQTQNQLRLGCGHRVAIATEGDADRRDVALVERILPVLEIDGEEGDFIEIGRVDDGQDGQEKKRNQSFHGGCNPWFVLCDE